MELIIGGGGDVFKRITHTLSLFTLSNSIGSLISLSFGLSSLQQAGQQGGRKEKKKKSLEVDGKGEVLACFLTFLAFPS